MYLSGFVSGVHKPRFQEGFVNRTPIPTMRFWLPQKIWNEVFRTLFRCFTHRLRHLEAVDVDGARLAAVLYFRLPLQFNPCVLPFFMPRGLNLPKFPRLVRGHGILCIL